jgi:phage gpG-like protein
VDQEIRHQIPQRLVLQRVQKLYAGLRLRVPFILRKMHVKMIDLSINLSHFDAWLSEIHKKADDLPLDEIGSLGVAFIHETFETAGRGSWRPTKVAVDHPLLIDSGDLMESITAVPGSDEVTFDSDLPYAAYQNSMRPFMFLDDSIDSEIEDILAKHFTAE